MNQPRINISWYIIGDIIGAAVTWISFYFLRTVIYGYPLTIPPGFYLGGFLYILGWVSLHFLTGAYEPVYNKSGISEVIRTFIVCTIGCLALLFFFILKNPQDNNIYYYKEFFSLLGPVFIITVTLRLLLLGISNRQLKKKQVFFNVLLVGSGKNALKFYDTFNSTKPTNGYSINCFLNITGNDEFFFPAHIKKYKELKNIDRIIAENEIEEVIITMEKNERALLTQVMQQLSDKDVNIKITADTLDILSGAVKSTNVMGVPLIDVHSGQLLDWQKNMKRFMDIAVAAVGIVALSPLLAYAAIRTKLSSPGSIFFLQERIGYKGKPFNIYKFRSMV